MTRMDPLRAAVIGTRRHVSLALVLLAAGCVDDAREPATAGWAPGPQADMKHALFFLRFIDGGHGSHPGLSDELKLDSFELSVTTAAHTVRSHLSLRIRNPGDVQGEALMRLPIPPGAAVTGLVLHDGTRRISGTFVDHDRRNALSVHDRAPVLVTWAGPDWIDVSVFPIEPRRDRTIELTWVEPTATSGGNRWYRIPVLAHQGREVHWPRALVVDGKRMNRAGRTWIPLAGSAPTQAVVNAAGDPHSYAFSLSEPSTPARLVLIADTSYRMSAAARERQRALIGDLLNRLPSDARITLLTADWDVEVLAQNTGIEEGRRSLQRLAAIPSAGALDLEYSLLVALDHARALGARNLVFLGGAQEGFHRDFHSVPLRRMHEEGRALTILFAGGRQEVLDVASLSGGLWAHWDLAEAVPATVAAALRPRPSFVPSHEEAMFPLQTVTGEIRWFTRFVPGAAGVPSSEEAHDLRTLWTRARASSPADGQPKDPGLTYEVLTPRTSLLVLGGVAGHADWNPETHNAPGSASEPSPPGVLAGQLPPKPSLLNDAGDGICLASRDRRPRDIDSDEWIRRTLPKSPEHIFSIEPILQDEEDNHVGTASPAQLDRAVSRGLRTQVVLTGTVRGDINPVEVGRVLRRHLPEVRYCYETQSRKQPGWLRVEFLVTDLDVVPRFHMEADLGSRPVMSCVASVSAAWMFPHACRRAATGVEALFVFGPSNSRKLPVPRPDEAGVTTWVDWSEQTDYTPKRVSSPFEKALVEWNGKGTEKARLGRAAQTLCAPEPADAGTLAWWTAERFLRGRCADDRALPLVTTLLRAAGTPRLAVRLGSERARHKPELVESKWRSWGIANDADRLAILTRLRTQTPSPGR